ncbi:Uncharacterized protein dnm_099100 [Desulfonema magnum]|uniref:Uncharacterized protein n=1 Tax=Desulfonema magnum TaxID=45655 RepID=A0A975BZ39_9BACT|nr:Uncharacterized protein dnm_099100 [Desulfonema magnum]
MSVFKYPIKFYTSFFCEQRRNPAFSQERLIIPEKKAGFLPRADIENL